MAQPAPVQEMPRQKQAVSRPIWERCGENFWCNRHHAWAYECECPPIEEWDRDPYSESDDDAQEDKLKHA